MATTATRVPTKTPYTASNDQIPDDGVDTATATSTSNSGYTPPHRVGGTLFSGQEQQPEQQRGWFIANARVHHYRIIIGASHSSFLSSSSSSSGRVIMDSIILQQIVACFGTTAAT